MIHLLLQVDPKYDSTTGYILMAFGALVLMYLMVIRPKMRKRDPLEDAGPRLSLSQQRNVEQQMQNLLVELSNMAREMNAQLDTRAKKLELLLEEADRKLAQLETMRAREDDLPRIVREPAEPAQTVAPDPVIEARPAVMQHEPDPRHAQVYLLADEGRSAPDIAKALGRPRGEIELILALRARA